MIVEQSNFRATGSELVLRNLDFSVKIPWDGFLGMFLSEAILIRYGIDFHPEWTEIRDSVPSGPNSSRIQKIVKKLLWNGKEFNHAQLERILPILGNGAILYGKVGISFYLSSCAFTMHWHSPIGLFVLNRIIARFLPNEIADADGQCNIEFLFTREANSQSEYGVCLPKVPMTDANDYFPLSMELDEVFDFEGAKYTTPVLSSAISNAILLTIFRAEDQSKANVHRQSLAPRKKTRTKKFSGTPADLLAKFQIDDLFD